MKTFYRIFLGLIILGGAIGKLLDISGFGDVIGTYDLGLSPGVRIVIAILVIAFELVLGIWLLSGKNISAAALAALVMNTGYFLLLTTSLLRGLELNNCGCFGVFLARPLTWYSPLEDLILMAFSYHLFLLNKKSRI